MGRLGKGQSEIFVTSPEEGNGSVQDDAACPEQLCSTHGGHCRGVHEVAAERGLPLGGPVPDIEQCAGHLATCVGIADFSSCVERRRLLDECPQSVDVG